MNTVTAIAPGKLILTGEHAVVYQRPALISAIDLWLRITLSQTSGSGVSLQLTDLRHRESTDWSSIRAYADTVRERWHQYAEDPSSEAFARMQGDDPAHLIKVALGEVARHVPGDPAPALDVTVQSEQPIGAGFGSSAAVAVAVVRAYLAFQEVELNDDALYELVLDVERRQHGTPSGVDPATVLQGGLVWAERTDEQLQHQSVAARSPVLDKFRVYHTGRPDESTGAVVDAVRERREKDPSGFRTTLDRIEESTRALRAVLSEQAPRPDEARRAVRRVESGLEALGVVPEPVQELIRTVEAKGGAAKISGAGALSGSNAGSLLVYHPDPEASVWGDLRHLHEIDACLAAPGVRIQDDDD